jgi:hypothetical protein
VAQLKLNSDWGLALRRSLGWQAHRPMQSFTPVPGSTLHLWGVGKNRIGKNTTIKSVDGGADRGEGVHTGSKDVRGYIFGAVGMLVALGTLVMPVVTRTH